MSVNAFMKKIDSIKKKYEDTLMEIRYSLLQNPNEREKVVEVLQIMNNASDDVIDCMQIAEAMDKQEARKKCMEIIEDNLPEYFYFLEDEKQLLKQYNLDAPRKL